MYKYKIYKWIMLISLFFWGIFYIFPIIYISSFQKELSNVLSRYLERQVGAEIDIDEIEFHFFDKLCLKNINIKDKGGDSLFFAKEIKANFDFFLLFKNQIYLNSVYVNDFTISVTRKSIKAPLNIQFFINFFKKKQLTGINIIFQNFFLKNGNFSYFVKNEKSILNKFNINDIRLSNIKTTVQLCELTSNTLKINIKQLNFIEKSGFKLKQLAFNLVMNRKTMKINRFNLILPRSHVLLTKITAKYNHFQNFFTKKTHFDFQIEPSQIYLKDICFLFPEFSRFQNRLKIMGKFTGKLENFRLNNLTIKENNNFTINTDIKVLNLSNICKRNIQANIKNSYTSSSTLQKVLRFLDLKSTSFYFFAKKIGKVFFRGVISCNSNNLITNIDIGTNVGHLQADIKLKKDTFWFLSAKISTTGLNMQKLIGNNNYGSIVKLTIDLNSTFNSRWRELEGKVAISIKDINYGFCCFNCKDIYLFGNFTLNSFNGILKINTPNGRIVIDGCFFLKGKNFRFNFLVNGFDIAFTKLLATTKYKNFKLSFVSRVNLVGTYPNYYNGSIVFHKLLLSADKSIFSVNPINIDIISSRKNTKRLLLRSNIVNGEINGFPSIKKLMCSLQRVFSFYIPSLVLSKQFSFEKEDPDFQLNLTINDGKDLFNFLKLPFTACKQLYVNVKYCGLYNKLCLDVSCSYLNIYNYAIENLILSLDNKNNHINLNLNGLVSFSERDCKLAVFANSKIRNDSVYSIIKWRDNENDHHISEFNFITTFLSKKINSIFVQINPSELFINDIVWKIAPACVLYNRNTNKISVDHFIAKSDSQIITVNGNMFKNKNGGLYISFEEIDIGHIFKIFHNKASNFGGIASGYIIIDDIFCISKLFSNLNIKHLVFENLIIGDLILNSQLDKRKREIAINGKIFNGGNNYVNIDGIVSHMKEKNFISLDMHNIKINFLNKLFDNNMVSDFSGQLTGKLCFFGNFSKPKIKGNIWISNGLFKVNNSNTYYNFSNWIKCTSGEISIRNAIFYDKYKNKGIADVFINHDSFRNLHLAANLSYNNLLILNTSAFDNNFLFNGRVFATGVATLIGNKKLFLINALFHNDENTIFTINSAINQNVVDYDFVIFSKKKNDKNSLINKQKNTTNIIYPEVDVDLITNINNKAILEILTNYISESKINLLGHGDLQIKYGTKTPLKIFGKYTIEKGNYNFLGQRSVSKKIEIEEGSFISFYGDPFVSDLNIKVFCPTMTSIQNLLVDKSNQFTNIKNNIPVNWILLISGQLKSPNVTFDLEFPGLANELKKKIKNCIITNGVNWQMLYLFTSGYLDSFLKFYKKEIKLNNNFSKLTTSIFFTQLFNTLCKIENDKFRIGVKYNAYETEAKDNIEMSLFLYSRSLNNRLTINTNFICIDNPVHPNLVKNFSLVKDCDIEYKFTKNGNISLKCFNRYNYHNYMSSKFTQGIEIIFQKKF